jgi:hypothetical protein
MSTWLASEPLASSSGPYQTLDERQYIIDNAY